MVLVCNSLSPPHMYPFLPPPYYYERSKLPYTSSFYGRSSASLMQRRHWHFFPPLDSKMATLSTWSQYEKFWCPSFQLSILKVPPCSLYFPCYVYVTPIPWCWCPTTLLCLPILLFFVHIYPPVFPSHYFLATPFIPLFLYFPEVYILTIFPLSFPVESLASDILAPLCSASFFLTFLHSGLLWSALLVSLISLLFSELWFICSFSYIIDIICTDHLYCLRLISSALSFVPLVTTGTVFPNWPNMV